MCARVIGDVSIGLLIHVACFNDADQNYQETEEDEKWREEQEKEWERQQAIQREEEAKAKAEVRER